MKGESRAKKGCKIGIKWKVYAILVLFIGIIVGVVWFLQAQLLHYFFQATKFNELEMSAKVLSAELPNRDRLKSVAEEYATNYYTDIWVYGMDENGILEQILEMQETGGTSLIRNQAAKFETFCKKAIENDGVYVAMVSAAQLYQEAEISVLRDNLGSPRSHPYVGGNSGQISAIYVMLRQVGDTQYMIIQCANLTPFQAMIKALQHQFLWTGVLLALIALVMSLIISKLITKPIVRMNESAKRLAKGQYDAEFVGEGYREIGELAETLNFASKELAKTDHFQKELISNISHDLRTPLTMIKGYSEVMRDIPGENTPENIQIVIDETSRLSELVNDMLDLSRIQAGTRKPELQEFSLTETVRDTMLRYERLIMQDGYRIDFFATEDVEVVADRGMILQVIYNLINNAVNYTGEDKYVSVKQEVLGNRVRISFTDTGEGIAKEQIPLIWDRYYKVDRVHRCATVGTGLGLSIVKGLLELHHAVYGVQSIAGKGSVFWFEMNIVQENESLEGYIEADYEIKKMEDKR